jgi:hypothetical protein
MGFVVFKLRMDCDECGSVVFLDGPALTSICSACKATLDFSADEWKTLLKDGDTHYYDVLPNKSCRGTVMSAGRRYVYYYAIDVPRCPSCKVELDLCGFDLGSDCDISCKSCGATTSTFPAPEWLRPVLPRAQQIFCAVREGASETLPPDSPALKPVMLSCLTCGGGLQISHQSNRITLCAYCDSEIYVPDAVWRHMHPIRKRVPWYVFFGEAVSMHTEASTISRESAAHRPMATCALCGTAVPRASTFESGAGAICQRCYLSM